MRSLPKCGEQVGSGPTHKHSTLMFVGKDGGITYSSRYSFLGWAPDLNHKQEKVGKAEKAEKACQGPILQLISKISILRT